MPRGPFYIPNPASGGRKPVHLITDRAKRYRANSPANRPPGPRKCALCGSRKNVGVMHLDGNESHGDRKNLAWGCRSCNTRLGVLFKKLRIGRPTRQYNPEGPRVPTFQQYAYAVAQHRRGTHDEWGAVIHATPKAKRIEYAQQIAEIKTRRGSHRKSEVPF